MKLQNKEPNNEKTYKSKERSEKLNNFVQVSPAKQFKNGYEQQASHSGKLMTKRLAFFAGFVFSPSLIAIESFFGKKEREPRIGEIIKKWQEEDEARWERRA